jgi:hypothetical protein
MIMAGWRLKKGADGPKRLAGTLAPPKTPIKMEKHVLQSSIFAKNQEELLTSMPSFGKYNVVTLHGRIIYN